MAFRRSITPITELRSSRLTAAMVGIGMNLAAVPSPDPNIEDTLLFASEAGMLGDDLRVLGLLTTWMGVHGDRVLADRLCRLIRGHEHERVRAYWAAIGQWRARDRRFARLVRMYDGPPMNLLPVGTDFQLARRGTDERFAESRLRVPAGVLRDRRDDILSPSALASCHSAYRYRVIIGATYRADVWASLVTDPSLNASHLARKAYCSFATAWQARRDFEIVGARLDADRGKVVH